MNEDKLRDKIVLKVVEMFVDRGMDDLMSQSNLSYFLRSNPMLLADAIVEGRVLTCDEMATISGHLSS